MTIYYTVFFTATPRAYSLRAYTFTNILCKSRQHKNSMIENILLIEKTAKVK